MAKKLEGRIALITGASRGIGAEIAKLYASEGAHVILLARSKDGLEAVDDAIRAAGGQATLMPFDISKLDELEALGPTISERFGKLDIWVANAGLLRELTPISHSKMKDWHDIMAVNLLSNVQMIRTLEPLLKASDAGRAIFVGSYLGENPTAYFGAYGASKAAVMHLAQTWAAETKHTPLRVNVIEPGAVDTEMLKVAFPGGYHAPDLRSPAQVAPLFLELALPSSQFHGEICRL